MMMMIIGSCLSMTCWLDGLFRPPHLGQMIFLTKVMMTTMIMTMTAKMIIATEIMLANAGWVVWPSPPWSNDVFDNEVGDDDECIARVEYDGNHDDNNE